MTTNHHSIAIAETCCTAAVPFPEHKASSHSSELKEHPACETFLQRFEEQVALTPNSVAILFENRETSYQQLNAQANQLAQVSRPPWLSNGRPNRHLFGSLDCGDRCDAGYS